MPSIVVIDKNGVISDTIMKQFNEDELYKKAGFKTPKHFECIKKHCWSINHNNMTYKISVYGKTDGRESTINKYDLPPPLDVLPFNKPHIYGPIIIVNENENGVPHDIKTGQWIQLYDFLTGGVDDTGSTEDDDEDEEEVAKNPDKNGYEKDDFVVSDGEEEAESSAEDEDEDEDIDSGEDEDSEGFYEGDDSDLDEGNSEVIADEVVKSSRPSRKRESKKQKREDFDYCEEELDFEEYFE